MSPALGEADKNQQLRILFITDNFPPEVNAPATRTYEHCTEWVKQGAEVTVITCVPNFPHGNIYADYTNKLFQKEQIEDINVIRVWSYITSNSGFGKRIMDYSSFALIAFWVGLFQKHDVIIATSPQFFTTWAARGISTLRRKPWIFELRDLWPASIKTVGAMKQGKLLDWLEKIELSLYKNATAVIAVTPAFKSDLIHRGIQPEKIKVVTNGSNLALFKVCKKDSELLSNLNLHDKFIIGYIGTHGLAHSLDFIINAIANIDNSNIHFLFIGDGAMKQSLVSLAQEQHLNNISFLDPIPKEEVPRYLSIIDVSLAPLKKSDTFKLVIPSKIFEASAMQKPTLLGVEGQAQELIEEYGAGLCFEPENEMDFLEKIQQICKPTLYTELQEGCRRLALDYDRKKLATKMLNIIRTTIKP